MKCDLHDNETEELIANLHNGRNTVLISPRRIGKTGLIKNVFYHILEQEKDAKCLYIDIFATRRSTMTLHVVSLKTRKATSVRMSSIMSINASRALLAISSSCSTVYMRQSDMSPRQNRLMRQYDISSTETLCSTRS